MIFYVGVVQQVLTAEAYLWTFPYMCNFSPVV